MALELTQKPDFSPFTLPELTDTVPTSAVGGMTFPNLSDLSLSSDVLGKAYMATTLPVSTYNTPAFAPTSGTTSGFGSIDTMGNLALLTSKSYGDKQFKAGMGLKSLASAGKFFTELATFGTGWDIANKKAQNTKLAAELNMIALDNQILYNKNQLTDKFNTMMARNTVLMAAKGLRVSAGEVMEKTKDAAYDATQDLRTLESNAEIQKIALRSAQKQANIARHLEKTLLTTNLVSSAAELGLNLGVAYDAGVFGDLFSIGNSLNDTVYGG